MKVIYCLDDENGMLFNKRRQSRDSKLIDDIVDSIGLASLIILPFSAILFGEREVRIVDSPEQIKDTDFYIFNESESLASYSDKIDEIIIYRWNRKYPADFRFDLDLSMYKLESSTDFIGSSHDKITKEIWKL